MREREREGGERKREIIRERELGEGVWERKAKESQGGKESVCEREMRKGDRRREGKEGGEQCFLLIVAVLERH